MGYKRAWIITTPCGNQSFSVAIHVGATNLLCHTKRFGDVLESIGVIADDACRGSVRHNATDAP
jgi:hypothetical protein